MLFHYIRAEDIAVRRAPARKEDRKKTGSFALRIGRIGSQRGTRRQAPAGHDCTHPAVDGCRLDPHGPKTAEPR